SAISVSSTNTEVAWRLRMPSRPVRVPTVPDAPVPLMLMPRRRTERVGSFAPTGMLTVTPIVPLARIDPYVPVQSIVMDLVMVTVPKPPGSRQLISPLMNVLLMAPAKVLQGAVRLQGSASLPTPDTKVRVAWALAGPADKVSTTTVARIEMDNALLRMRGSLVVSDCLAVRGSFTRESPIEL